MRKLLAASAATVLLGASLLSSTQAAPPSRDLFWMQTMQEQHPPKSSPQTAVTRSGTILVTGHIKVATNIAEPVTCSIRVYHNGIYEYATRQATFQERNGSCGVPIVFKWTAADDTQPVIVDVQVEGEFADSDIKTSDRESDFEFPEMSLPAEGSTTRLSFDTTL